MSPAERSLAEPPAQSCSATTYSYTGPAATIPDNNSAGVNVTLPVSGFSGTIGDLNFRFDGSACTATAGATTVGLDHTWVGDLVVKLTSPQGTTVTLVNRAGSSGNNFCSTALTDEGASASIQTISASGTPPLGPPYTGTFTPANPLSAFRGQDPSGTWTLNVSDLAGSDMGSVRAFSLVVSPCQEANTPPTVSITSPVGGATFSAPASVTISASASDSDGAVSKVEFFQGATKIGEDTTAPFSFAWSNIAAGSYSLTAKATDGAGAATTSSAVSITVNPNTPPAVSFTGPADGAVFDVPADIVIAASASDNDGTVSKVEFFDGTNLLGSDTTVPYSYAWHAPAGSHTLTAKATDNGGAATISSPVNISINALSVPPAGHPCPTESSEWKKTDQFDSPGQIYLGPNGRLDLAPCEQITFNLSWNNTPNTGGLFTITLYNYKGQELYSETWNGTTTGYAVYPNSAPAQYPWRVTRSPEGIPAYAIFKAAAPFGAPAKYSVGYSRQPRQNYNLGGAGFDDAPLVTFPSTYYGSTYQKMQPQHPVDPGQYFRVHLEPGQGFFVSGYATASPNYGANFTIELYDSERHLLPPSVLVPNWVNTTTYGREEYKSQTFVNTGPNPADFYIRAWSKNWPTWDFEMSVQLDQCPVPPEDKPAAPAVPVATPISMPNSEYKLPAAADPDVLSPAPGEDLAPGDPATGRETELWARVYRPSNFSAGPYPLIILLHGNHGTCGWGTNPREDKDPYFSGHYARTGRCPLNGETISSLDENNNVVTSTAAHNYGVVPSHAGYDYLAQQLAFRGYIVVSINSNRGINMMQGTPEDPSLILARGRLVLKHLQKLSEWNANGGPYDSGTPPGLLLGVDLKDKIDFGNVGMMGHSRGGQGVRAAYNLYHDAGSLWPARILRPVEFKAIFELAPTDALTQRTVNGTTINTLDAVTPDTARRGTKWNVLLPMCDGDVFTMAGVHPFDRMMLLNAETPATPKSTYTVWGANHNFFNTEWQQPDPIHVIPFTKTGCIGGGNPPIFGIGSTVSPQQQQVAHASVVAFFRANVGATADATYNQGFNPRYKLPDMAALVTRIDRGFTPSPDASLTLPFDNLNNPAVTSYCAPPNTCPATTTHFTVTPTAVPNHYLGLRAAAIRWDQPGTDKMFEVGWAGSGGSVNLSTYQTLDFRISREDNSLLNLPVPTNFSIRLVRADGSLSNPVSLCKYEPNLRGPVGGYDLNANATLVREARHPLLETVRIPLSDFTGVSLTQVKGVRFVFDGSATGAIYLTNIRFSK